MSSPNLVERLVMTIESLRVALKGYALLDSGTQKQIRHQVYSRTGGFGKALFKPTESLAADYDELEQKLGQAPFVNDTITVKIKDGVVTVLDLPPYMRFQVNNEDSSQASSDVTGSGLVESTAVGVEQTATVEKRSS